MPFIGGRKSREGQRRFVDAFFKIEAKLEWQSKARETLAYQVRVHPVKTVEAFLPMRLKKFVVFAKVQGSSNATGIFLLSLTLFKSRYLSLSHTSQGFEN